MSTQRTTNGKASDGVPEDTLIGVVLDRSGSMSAVREETIAGFNHFLHEQQKEGQGGHALLSLTQFDDRYEVNFVGEPLENVPELDVQSYVPRGMTALFDAIGRTIHALDAWVKEHDWQERVLLLIISDGEENASKEYDLAGVGRLIEAHEQAGWNVAYMGANQDSFAVGRGLHVRADFTANYAATPEGTLASFGRMSDSAARYRSSGSRGRTAAAFFAGTGEESPPGAGRLTPKKSDPGAG